MCSEMVRGGCAAGASASHLHVRLLLRQRPRGSQKRGSAILWHLCDCLDPFAGPGPSPAARWLLMAQCTTRVQAAAGKLFLRAAQLKLPEGQYNLAVCHAMGRGVAQDYVRAVELYRKAAGQGHVDAMCNLALCLEKGQGVPLDPEGAFLWFKEAFEKKNSESARYHLGRCYFRGIGTPKDERKAAAILGERVWELGRSGA